MDFKKTNDKEKQEQRHDYNQEYRKFKWDALRKTIFRLINKVSISNIHHVVGEILNENLIVGLVEKILIKRLRILKNNYTYKNVKLQMKWIMKFLNKNVGLSIEQEIPAEAKSEVSQNVEEEVEHVKNSGKYLYKTEQEELELEQNLEVDDD
ncbi:MIF4G-like domain superfamily [Forsythia ovata]|uniref:MIF4G-like domain superfamily n=1 Tax=Forsythia ovata TaxID=205694 RepID=A0ABD1T5P1_9LAMI